jgi:L-arabinonolactonase
MYEVEHIASTRNALGEGPVWHHVEHSLYWVDIDGSCFHRYVPATGENSIYKAGVRIGALAPRAKGGFVLATERGFALWEADANRVHFLNEPLISDPSGRFNDGAVDARGDFWAGLMSENIERRNQYDAPIYRLSVDRTVEEIDIGYGLPNGMGWSPDSTIMYIVDSMHRAVFAYDYDIETGAIAHRRVAIDTSARQGVPDGMTVDSEGYLWVAFWDGWSIVRYDPNGGIVREIQLPVQRPTSCAFGGDDLSDLYITSARVDLSAEELAKQPFAGDLLRIRMDIKGQVQQLYQG